MTEKTELIPSRDGNPSEIGEFGKLTEMTEIIQSRDPSLIEIGEVGEITEMTNAYKNSTNIDNELSYPLYYVQKHQKYRTNSVLMGEN